MTGSIFLNNLSDFAATVKEVDLTLNVLHLTELLIHLQLSLKDFSQETRKILQQYLFPSEFLLVSFLKTVIDIHPFSQIVKLFTCDTKFPQDGQNFITLQLFLTLCLIKTRTYLSTRLQLYQDPLYRLITFEQSMENICVVYK